MILKRYRFSFRTPHGCSSLRTQRWLRLSAFRLPLSAFHNQSGFTVIELLSASLLMLFFLGWLTWAYLIVTRAVFAWQEDWTVAAATQRFTARLARDLERAARIDNLSTTGVTLTRPDGRTITYDLRSDGVYINDRKAGAAEMTVTDLQLTGLWAHADPYTGARRLVDTPPVELLPGEVRRPDWMRLRVSGQTPQGVYTTETVVPLLSRRPDVLRELDITDPMP